MPTPEDSTIGAGRRSVETVTKEVNALADYVNHVQTWFTRDANAAFSKAHDALMTFIPEFLESYRRWSHELDDVEGLQKEAAALQSRISDDGLQEKKLNAELKAMNEKLTSTQNKLQEQGRKRDEAVKDSKASQDEIARNQTLISERIRAIEEEEGDLRKAEGEVKKKTVALEAKEETLNGLRDRSLQLQDRCKVREDDLTTAATRLAAACDVYLDYGKLMAQPNYVQSLFTTLASFVKDKTTQLEESVRQRNELQEDSSVSKKRLEDQLTKANEDLTASRNQCQTLQNKINEFEVSQTKAEREKTKTNSDLAEAQIQCATLEKRVKEIKSSQTKAEQDKDEAKNELQKEKIAHGEQKVVNDGLRGHYDRLAPFEQQLTDSKTELAQNQAKLEFEKQRTETLTDEVEKLKEMCSQSDQHMLLQALTIKEGENRAAEL